MAADPEFVHPADIADALVFFAFPRPGKSSGNSQSFDGVVALSDRR